MTRMRRNCIAMMLVFLQAAGPSSGLSVGHDTAISMKDPPPWCTADIDYSAANEFIAAHYGSLHGRQKYFKNDRAQESIYNARLLGNSSTLQDSGFCLRQQQDLGSSTNWNDLNSIREAYLPRLRDELLSVYGNESVSEIIFWCPTLRTENSQQTPRNSGVLAATTPGSGYVSSVHIDTDVNAYQSGQQMVEIVVRNVFPGETVSNNKQQMISAALEDGKRFAIVNAWRNIGSNPVQRAPLAFFPARYTDDNTAFPRGIPAASSKWYAFPDMRPDELLLFCQYDRDATYPSDLWHCALVDTGLDAAAPRESFDVRCFVLFRDVVPVERDRLGHLARRKSMLNQQESQKFCSQQAKRRRRRQQNSQEPA